MTATKLRSELYRVLDQVLESGEPVEVVRRKGTIVIRPTVAARAARKKARSPANPNLVVGSPDDLVHFDWATHWKPFL